MIPSKISKRWSFILNTVLLFHNYVFNLLPLRNTISHKLSARHRGGESTDESSQDGKD